MLVVILPRSDEMAKTMRKQFPVTTDADGIAAGARAASKGRGPAPVHLWNPPFCGDMDMRIARDGTWYYLGSPITRPAMVKMFSNILRKDGDAYFLVTPVEKVGITVDDAPFVALDFEVQGTGKAQELTFVTHVGDRVVAGADTPIRVHHDPETGAPAPYVVVRANLEALIDRKSFYRLMDLGCEQVIDDTHWFGVFSGGTFFPITPSDHLS